MAPPSPEIIQRGVMSLLTVVSCLYAIYKWPYKIAPIFCIIFLIICRFYKKNYYEIKQIDLVDNVDREWYIIDEQNDKNRETFKIMSYNVLANGVAFKFLFQHTSWAELNFFKYRGPRMVQEIGSSLPGIIYLQEIDQYENFWKEQLEKLGYKTFLNSRKKLLSHGVLVGYQTQQWDLIDLENIDMDDASDLKKYKTKATGIMAILESKESGKRIIVCSLHTYYKGTTVKYLQIAYSFHRIQSFLQRTQNIGIPIILAGDLNGNPKSPMMSYIYGQPVQPEQSEEYMEYQNILQKYPFIFQDKNLSSAYDQYPNHFPWHVTHVLPGRQQILDYIYYSASNLKLIGLLKPAPQSLLTTCGGCPNQFFSSDHLRIEAQFQFD